LEFNSPDDAEVESEHKSQRKKNLQDAFGLVLILSDLV
jgi:hypothetical protein